MKTCRFKKTCKEEICENEHTFNRCEIYKRFEREMKKEKIPYRGIER